jgi:hypothetical protein
MLPTLLSIHQLILGFVMKIVIFHKRARILLVSLAMIALLIHPNIAQAIDTPLVAQTSNPTLNTPGTFGFSISEGGVSYLSQHPSSLVANDGFSASGARNSWSCKSMDDENCLNKDIATIDAYVTAPPCEIDASSVCIEGLVVIDAMNQRYMAKLKRLVNGPTFVGNQKLDLPNGSTTSLWNVAELANQKNFAIAYTLNLQTASYNSFQFTPEDYGLVLRPYVERKIDNASEEKITDTALPDGSHEVSWNGFPSGHNCVWVETGKCGIEQEFDDDYRFEIVVRTPKAIAGWLNGRLINPNISLSKYNNQLDRLTIQGAPADVPFATGRVQYIKATEAQKELYKQDKNAMAGATITELVESSSERSFDFLKVFKEILGDSSQNKISHWAVNSLSSNSLMSNESTCLNGQGKLVGLVTTNAMIYSGGPPNFISGTLKYKVGGLHFNPDGSVFQGTYDMLVKSDTARCLYNFSNAPIQAEVSVISENGTAEIATTTVKETNGWIHLSAYNFTFSNPTISVKFKQPGSTGPKQVQKMYSFTCVKGKTQ